MALFLPSFRGGLHPPERKLTAGAPIELCPLPEELVVPLAQHLGAPAVACVAAGQKVGKGEVIGEAKGFVSAPVHAPTSGEVVAVEPRPHPQGRALPAVVIRPDGADAWVAGLTPADPAALDREALVARIHAAGVVGMGGATFPTHVKLTPPAEKPIHTLLVNGVECEPYLTADHRLMLEEPERLLAGIAIVRRVLGVERVVIGIEANKPDAIALLTTRCADQDITVTALAVKYPQGSEKQLIQALTGREVPSGGLPMDVGVVVQNVATLAAVADAVHDGTPLIERICTVTGPALQTPKNLRIRIGTPLAHLVAVCGGLREAPGMIVMGGPMMGQAQLSLAVPATKGSSGVLLLRPADVSTAPAGPCIRCARCVQVCPIRLAPTTIAASVGLERFEAAEQWRALDCIECGSCSYTCPAALPLVQSIRHAKATILARRRR